MDYQFPISKKVAITLHSPWVALNLVLHFSRQLRQLVGKVPCIGRIRDDKPELEIV